MIIRALLIGLSFFLAQAANADELSGRVIGVIDGDTLDVLVGGHDKFRIRVSGIDAPEKSQPFGRAAKRHMSDLVFDRNVDVEYTKRDRYGRIIGVVRVEGQDAGLNMIRSGMAWHYKQYQREQKPEDRTSYSAAESAARDSGAGLWSDGNPVPPWNWRRQR